MSKHNRKRKKNQRAGRKVLLLRDNHPVYSEETMKRLENLQPTHPGIHKLCVVHEQFCADALRLGAKKCMCIPEITIVDGNSTSERDQRMNCNHWANEIFPI